MTSITKSFVYGLPKAELHLHLEGTLEPDLKLKLAEKNGIDIGQTTIEEVKESYNFHDLTSFLGVYYPGMNVLQTEEDFYELAMEYFKRASEHNVKYAEVFFDPQAHTSRGIAFETFFEGYYRATQDAMTNYGLKVQLIMCFLRDFSAESAMEHYIMAKPYQDRILGIGLDSDERDNPPLKFQEVFALAKAEGYHITMHCDIDQVGSIDNIRDALLKVGVERLDHGTNIVEDEALVEYVLEHGIGLTSCPVSNAFVTEDMKAIEIKYLLNKGVKVTVNSDDPAYFQSYISDDLLAVVNKVDLNKEELVTLVKNAFEISWISSDERQAYIAMLDEYVSNN